MSTIKKLWHYILTNKHTIGDFIWQLDNDLETLNAMIVEAERGIRK